MTNFNGRKVPNVSQYVANLNTLPSAHDVASQQQDENFDIDNDLAQFTNAEFLDFDTGNFYDPQEMGKSAEQTGEGKGMDFVNDHTTEATQSSHADQPGLTGSFPFAELPNFPLNTHNTLPPSMQNPYASTSPNALYQTTPTAAFSPTPYPGQKHSLSNSPTPQDFETQLPETKESRLAAEEDKRRRNTAASARFRVKKKQREQALEANAKELENKSVALEQRIVQLEMENEWLRGLVVEKNGGEKEDLKIKYQCSGEAADDRKGGKAKKGVGTKSQEDDEDA